MSDAQEQPRQVVFHEKLELFDQNSHASSEQTNGFPVAAESGRHRRETSTVSSQNKSSAFIEQNDSPKVSRVM